MKNILFLIADDLGRDTGFLGNPVMKTPHLDRLASQGVSFDQAFCTTATCSASRASMFTGLHNHQIGHYGHCHWYHHFETFGNIESAPKIFNRAGYLTAILGKVHVAPEAVYPWEIRKEGFQGNRDVQALARAAGEIFRTGDNRPFFLTVGFGDTHRDHTRKGFANADYPGVTRQRFRSQETIVPSCLPDIPQVREELAEYYESASRLDQGVGMIPAELHRAGHADDTLILFVSDNGIPFINSKTTLFEAGIHLPMFLSVPGRPGGARNPNMVSYLDILPTFMDWAGIGDEAGAPNDSLAADQWARGPGGASPRREGRSLLPIFDAQEELPEWSQILCSHTFHEVTNYYPTRVLRTRRHKYHKNVVWKTDFPFASDLYASLTWEGIKRSGSGMIGKRPIKSYLQRPLEELYDLQSDPDEVVNLAGLPEHQELLDSMRARVNAWQKRTDDPWLFRDGVSVKALRRYIDEEGLEVPDGNDMVY